MSRWSISGLASRLEGFTLGPIDLELPPGLPVAVLGRSGTGKTTLLRSVAGFVPTTGGRILRDGVDLVRFPPEERSVGYVPQGLGLFPHLSVEQNVRYPLDLRRVRRGTPERVRGLLRRFGLEALASRQPSRLSAGEAQKVALARALAADADLLLWDEPAHALDVEDRDELVRIFRELGREEGLGLLLVTHDPVLAFALAERFVVLSDGRVRFSGDARELIDRPPDSFSARFAGYENLYSRPRLEELGGGLAAWLLARSGPEGVAFPAPLLGRTDGLPGWEAEVEASRPGPEGTSVELSAGGLRLRARRSGLPEGNELRVGARVRFALDATSLRPLGGVPAERTGSAA